MEDYYLQSNLKSMEIVFRGYLALSLRLAAFIYNPEVFAPFHPADAVLLRGETTSEHAAAAVLRIASWTGGTSTVILSPYFIVDSAKRGGEDHTAGTVLLQQS